ELGPDRLAGVYYTSGTTGEPKGIERTHGNFLHKSLIAQLYTPLRAGSVVALLYACTYGASTGDIYPTLLSGATISMLDARRTDPLRLARWLVEQEVSHLHLHSSILSALLDFLADDAFFPDLLYVQPSQRLFHKDVARLWRHLPPQAIVVHRLSSTETGPIALLQLHRDDRHDGARDGAIVPVGYPPPGVELSIIDETGAQVEVGEIGEIVARGRFLPHRYWRRPEMSAQRFQVDPDDSRYRIVKLGDMGRFHADGCLELAGRGDHMVKIRGHRVELDEIESRLEQLPVVQRSVVIVRPDSFQDQMLIAYVQMKDSTGVDIGSLRAQLRLFLPDDMIPSRLIIVDRLPTLPNGKVDRAALPPPNTDRPTLDTPYFAPRTPVEMRVAAIWTSVLGLEEVGIYDSFLELGGHSLLAGRIVSQVLHEFQVDIPVSELFESPTVAHMALVITQRQAEKLDQATLQQLLFDLEDADGQESGELDIDFD
ncbi:MAG: non-ribosomal peptide synthetase, partial [Candidatus Promineifilaceae bacterium]